MILKSQKKRRLFIKTQKADNDNDKDKDKDNVNDTDTENDNESAGQFGESGGTERKDI